MKMQKMLLGLCLLGLISLVFAGCSQKADENTSVDDVKADAQKLADGKNIDGLKKAAEQLKSKIAAKTKELEPIVAKIKEIGIGKLIGPEAEKAKKEIESLKSDADTLKTAISGLKDRFKIYYDKLVELKADVSGLK